MESRIPRMKRYLTIALLILSSFSVFSAGKVIYTKGEVLINGKVIKKNHIFKKGDTLSTNATGLAIAKFDNGSTVKVEENSQIKLEVYLAKKRASQFSLIKGSSFFELDPKAKGKLSVRAREVAMGVRGTLFFVSFGQKEKKDVYMCVNKGKVAIKGKNQKRSVLVKEGEGVVVPKGEVSSKPTPLPWTKSLNWKLDPNETEDLDNKAVIQESYSNPLERDYD